MFCIFSFRGHIFFSRMQEKSVFSVGCKKEIQAYFRTVANMMRGKFPGNVFARVRRCNARARSQTLRAVKYLFPDMLCVSCKTDILVAAHINTSKRAASSSRHWLHPRMHRIFISAASSHFQLSLNLDRGEFSAAPPRESFRNPTSASVQECNRNLKKVYDDVARRYRL